jgi:hypothetical protein
MFSKHRKQRSSLKPPSTTDLSSTSTKDRSPVTATSNILSSSTNSTSIQPTIQSIEQKKNIFLNLLVFFFDYIGSLSTTTSNNSNGNVRRRFLNLLRFTASRPSSSVRFSRQRDTNACQSSKQQQQQQQQNLSTLSMHDITSITSSSAIIKDELIESVVASANEHVVNIISPTTNQLNDNSILETCVLCCQEYPLEQFERLTPCSHSYCRTCLKSYLKLEITEGRVTLNCPQKDCPERIHPSDISRILQKHPEIISKYEQFMVRRVLQSITDTRWCPAPDCGFAVIASGYASCPEIQCLRPGCNTSFCYHCKSTWHPNKTCEDAAREKTSRIRSGSFISLGSAQQRDEIKQCPRCQASILKMEDGSCVSFWVF